jgi:hypothetical protein
MRAVIPIVLVSAVASADNAAAPPQLHGDEILRGNVVKVEDKEIYVDLGAQRGVADGAPLRIKRPIKLKHPITRAVVDDWIPIGSATVTQAAGSLSRAVVGELVDSIKPGDVAEILVAQPGGEREPRKAPPPAGDPEVAEVLRVFAAHTGASIDARIAGWEHFLSVRPQTRFAAAIRTDIETLRALREELRTPDSAQISEPVGTVDHNPPTNATANVAVPLVFVMAAPDKVASAWLHFRTLGSRTYRRLLLVREHEIYLRGIVPAEAVKEPGLEYFVELSTPNGRSGLAVGTPDAPTVVAIAPPPLINRFDASPGRSSVKINAEYLDFATFDKRAGDRRDQMTMATVDFTYRMDRYVESLGVGYGIYDGKGGFANRDWNTDGPLPTSGFRFGYADLELGGNTEGVHVSAGGQVIAGVGKDGFGMGVEGRVRIGHRDDTNLLLSGRTVDQVGFLSEIKFDAKPIQHVLLGISVGATNQPTEGDVGVKLGTEVELVGINRVSVIARGSWQGRSVDHGGLGGGAGLGFYW